MLHSAWDNASVLLRDPHSFSSLSSLVCEMDILVTGRDPELSEDSGGVM